MNGENWDFIQYRFIGIIEDIEELIENNGKLITSKELKDNSRYDDDWYNKYPKDKYYYKHPLEVTENYKYSLEAIEHFNKAVDIIKIFQIYIQRLDWLLSGDDDEETFLKKIDEDLKKLKKI